MAAVHGARYRFFESVGKHYRERPDIDDVDLGGEWWFGALSPCTARRPLGVAESVRRPGTLSVGRLVLWGEWWDECFGCRACAVPEPPRGAGGPRRLRTV